MYKIKIYKNWPGKTEFYKNFENKTVGLYINENETASLDELLDWLIEQLKARDIKYVWTKTSI